MLVIEAGHLNDLGAPASALSVPTIWINRLGEEAEPQPDIELRSLTGLADSLDSLVSA